jgi:Uma2 family endonuclease
MSIADLPPTLEPAIPPIPVRRFTVEEFLQMFEAGLLPEPEHSELLEGWITTKMVKNPPHEVALDLTDEALRSVVPPGWRVRNQSSTRTADSVPEPDLAVVKGAARDYAQRHPGPADTAMVVEISDTSLRDDRKLKARIYARAGIAVYWIVNLVDSRIEVHTNPTGPDPAPSYRERAEYRDDDPVPVWIEGVEVGRILARNLLP